LPRARIVCEGGETTEWKSKALRSYQRRTATIDALIASACLAGTNTRRVKRALASLFAEGVGKDVVSRVWRKVKVDWDAWNARSLAEEPIIRPILDGKSIRTSNAIARLHKSSNEGSRHRPSCRPPKRPAIQTWCAALAAA
jgi:putative transposase